MGRPKTDPNVRFNKFWRLNPDTGCWDWIGAKSKNGYARFYVGPKPRQMGSGTRFSYRRHKGDIPEGLVLIHLCHDKNQCKPTDVCPHRSCVNPEHLRAVSPQEVLLRGHTNATKTHCPSGHEYSKENTIVGTRKKTGGAYRRCRVCLIAKERAKREYIRWG